MQQNFSAFLLRLCALTLGVAAQAQAQGVSNSDALATIAASADAICGRIRTSGEYQSEKVSGEIKTELNSLLKKLADAKISGAASYAADHYAGLLQPDLPSALKDQRDCKLRIFGNLVDKLIVPVERKPKECRIPSNGVERFQRAFDVTRESGWRGGGYDQNRWCNDLISVLRGEHPSGQFTIKVNSENQKNTCAPFNCPQYNYVCTVHVEADPIYKEAASTLCP